MCSTRLQPVYLYTYCYIIHKYIHKRPDKIVTSRPRTTWSRVALSFVASYQYGPRAVAGPKMCSYFIVFAKSTSLP